MADQGEKSLTHPTHRVGKIILDYLDIHVGDSLLEIGCSIGTQARQIAARGYQVFGIDQEFSLVAKFNTLANQAHLPNAFAFVADGHALPFPEHSFDSVVITEVLEHAHDPACMLGEIFRVLRRGGTLCLAVPTENTERLFTRLHPQWPNIAGMFRSLAHRNY
jgi:SAM-dependent methyltransferase